MLKETLRTLYKQKRRELTTNQKEALEQNIYQQLFKLDASDIQNVHLFLSMKKFNEVNTQPIIDYYRRLGKQIIVSKCNFEDDSLTHFYFDDTTQLELNKFGVPEPVNAKEAEVTEVDLVLVPLLISDKNNYRVGYGKGFYDRFLANCRTDVKTIGLNFFEPIDTITDLNRFDVPLDMVLYPKK